MDEVQPSLTRRLVGHEEVKERIVSERVYREPGRLSKFGSSERSVVNEVREAGHHAEPKSMGQAHPEEQR